MSHSSPPATSFPSHPYPTYSALSSAYGQRVFAKLRLTILSDRRYYNLQDSNVIGHYNVLSSGCSSKGRAAAQLANDPATFLASRLAAAASTATVHLSAMQLRLDALEQLQAAVLAQPAASLSIEGLGSAAPFVWIGLKQRICYAIPAYRNVGPKGLVLYLGNGAAGSYYPEALGAGNAPLPAGPTGCADFTVSRGVAAGRYTIALEDSATGGLFATVSFAADRASIAVVSYALSGSGLALTVRWRVPAARASPGDRVVVYGPRGAVAHWFYTSCNCQAAPGSAADPAGTFEFDLVRVEDPSVRGAYLAKLHPELGGGREAAAVAPDWVPWARLGW
jgi:hypothetical protein